MLEKIKETAEYLSNLQSLNPRIAIILGTGLGGLVKEIKVEKSIPYAEIPNFPVSTVEGHQGRLIFGTIKDVPVLAMQGRFHYYEGYSMQEVTFPIRVMKLIGITHLIVSNASGGMNPEFELGEIMIIDDHINLFGVNPLLGKNIDELGPRFPDMSQPYSLELIEKAKKIAADAGIRVKQGVYVGTSGPTFETPAEYKYFRAIGGDTVGMSTVPEVIVARHMGMTCFGFSIITDLGVPGKIVEISHEEVQQVAAEAEPKMTKLITELIKDI
ncbi:purine-nucleoside phosphorylase [Alkalitalea saponilacus]|uniref:Purine nucleoside phosphorylase n=1 Tax=Alkalitalea saponilacus TaxID=889453 RepID=A0A1T5HNJ5_9BACT|nr:purine-nucleoside phosphorylase [Alkalitalea saponilacus]ASB49331.1 purine-nucleoside phosphorylase [Alkalitalea saponilacus]SKC22254.1 purine-nucleoside phosphorylase [Alkalitalea saponilacus]